MPNCLFLTLNVFSLTGGIEKVSRVAGKALHEISAENNSGFQIFSMHDRTEEQVDERYFPLTVFRGYGGKKIRFVLDSIRFGRRADVVFLSHINLLTIGFAIKFCSPKTRIILLAHGIEVWKPLPAWKRLLLRNCDLILPISAFTRDRMVALHRLDEKMLPVVHNCLDPFLPPGEQPGKSESLRHRYGLTKDHKVLLTLCRLSFTEKGKGYDEVIRAVKHLKKACPEIRYLLAGKWDTIEKARLDRLIEEQEVTENVLFTGFVSAEELPVHYGLADLFIMPSRKEGFGLVFIEAMYYGVPVIAGNRDGSVDALAGGELGILVDPENTREIAEKITTVLNDPAAFQPLRLNVLKRFGFPVYKEALRKVISVAGRRGKIVSFHPSTLHQTAE